MSRFLPDNHPKRGLCTFCQKVRLLVSDLGIDCMIISRRPVDRTAGPVQQALTLKHPMCRACHNKLSDQDGDPFVNLASRGLKKRLTRKQTEKAARKLAYQLKKMQDES